MSCPVVICHCTDENDVNCNILLHILVMINFLFSSLYQYWNCYADNTQPADGVTLLSKDFWYLPIYSKFMIILNYQCSTKVITTYDLRFLFRVG